MTQKSYGVPAKSAIRALLILEYFEEMQSPLSLKAIADHFDLAASSASALLKNLANLDYLSYDAEERTYLPTLRLSRLGAWVEKRILDDGVADLVRRLQERTQETVVITTMNDLYVDFLYFNSGKDYDGIYSNGENLAYPRQGASITCPFSWYLLEGYNINRLESLYYRSKAKRLFDPANLSWPEFLDQIESTRRSKCILVQPWPFPDTAVLATLVPVLPFGRRVALGIGASAQRMKEKLPALLDAIDVELAQIRVKTDEYMKPDSDILHRLLHIDLKAPLFPSSDGMLPPAEIDASDI